MLLVVEGKMSGTFNLHRHLTLCTVVIKEYSSVYSTCIALLYKC